MSNIYEATKGILNLDGYKVQHIFQYPEGTEYVYANWTPRGTRIKGIDKVHFFGLQYTIQKRLMEDFEEFFKADVDEVCDHYAQVMREYMGEVSVDHIRALHNLGYLPLRFKALPEGTPVPLRVPMFTVENTHPDFFWLTNYFETVLSNELWMPMTSATTASRLRFLIDDWAIKTTGSAEGAGFQGHDFSMRGMAGHDASVGSAMGHLVAFTGTETVPVLQAIKNYYPTKGFIAGTVPATEHSVMCAGGMEDERETFQRLLNLYPTGILSVVSDTWDFWGVLTNHLPALKDQIMARDGKLVVRPDSGDPADIVCGTVREFGKGRTPAEKGTFELLWETFGGEVNEQGYKVLDSHIGVIYGDAMNYARIQNICERLAAKGFATTPMVFGLGSYNYQLQTRDTFGFAMKATNVVIDGEEKAIFKDPKTDDGLKRSLKGRIAVVQDDEGELLAIDGPAAVPLLGTEHDLLQTVWDNGEFVKRWSFDEVRDNAGHGA